jgi:CRISPR-associated endonuclease/helicase Cas3
VRPPIAHTARAGGPPHPLLDHLEAVAALAARNMPAWGSDWAALAGRWHDLGKYSAAFQDHLRRAGEDDAHGRTQPGRTLSW